MPLSKPQQLIADDSSRFRVAICGRRFGKTHLAIRELAKYARYPDRKVWYVAPSYRQAKQTVWSKLKKRLSALNWISKVNESDLTIVLKNGTEISLRGSDNYDSLRGVGLNFLVLDEFADINPEAWYEVLRPTLSDTGGHALFIGTPKGAGNWAREIYDNHKTKTGWRSWQFTTIDGGNVPDDEIEQAKLDLDPRTFRQEYLASFETYTGVIAYAFGDHNIAPAPAITPQTRLIVGVDFNVSIMSSVVMIQTAHGLHAIDEVMIRNSNTDELVAELRRRYPTNPIDVYPDPAGVQRKTSANGNTDIKILQNAGFRVIYHSQHPLVKDRINAANSLFKKQPVYQRFLVDPKCKQLIKSLQQFCYKEGTEIPDKDSGFDHAFDAVTYAIQYMFPIRRDIKPQPTQRFGVAVL